MLKRQNRFPKGHVKTEKTLNSQDYVLKIAKNKKSLSRFAFAVPKKIDKRATVRNRIKREFRRCIEERLEEIATGYDFLFTIKNDIQDKDFCGVLWIQLKKEGLLK